MKTNIFADVLTAIVHFLVYVSCFAFITSCTKQITDIPAAENNTEKSSITAASPTVKFTFPKNEDTVFGTITIKIKATSDVAIDSVQCKIDGVWYGSKTAAPYNFNWNTTTVFNGAHQLQATVFDHAGNSKTKKIIVHVLNAGGLSTQVEQDLLALINAERANRGLTTLIFNSNISKAARGHAQDMADNNFYSHSGWNGSTLGDRLTAAGYAWTYAAENLYAGVYSTTAAEVYNSWMGNFTQRSIMLDPIMRDAAVGFGYSFQSTYKHYWVLNVGRQF